MVLAGEAEPPHGVVSTGSRVGKRVGVGPDREHAAARGHGLRAVVARARMEDEDVVTERGLRDRIRDRVLREAVPL